MRSYFAMALLGALSLAEDEGTVRTPKVDTQTAEFKNIQWFSGPQLLIDEDDQKLYAGGKVAWEIKKVQETDEDGNVVDTVDAVFVYQTIGVNIVNEVIEDGVGHKSFVTPNLDGNYVIDVAFCGFDDAMETDYYKCMGAKFNRDEKKTDTYLWAGKTDADNKDFQPTIPMGADLYSQLNVDSEPELNPFHHLGMYEIKGADITASVMSDDLDIEYGIVKSATRQDWTELLEVTIYFVSKREDDIQAYKDGKPKNTGYMYVQYQEADDESVNLMSSAPAVQQTAAEGKTGGDSSWFKNISLNGAGHLTASAIAFMLVTTIAF